MKPIPSEWLQPGAIVPVTPDVVRELLECVRVAYKAGQEAEREACEKVCDDLWQEDGTAYDCREAIRARGQA